MKEVYLDNELSFLKANHFETFNGKSQRIRKSQDLVFSSFWLIFDVDSDELVGIGIFKLFRIPRNKV